MDTRSIRTTGGLDDGSVARERGAHPTVAHGTSHQFWGVITVEAAPLNRLAAMGVGPGSRSPWLRHRAPSRSQSSGSSTGASDPPEVFRRNAARELFREWARSRRSDQSWEPASRVPVRTDLPPPPELP